MGKTRYEDPNVYELSRDDHMSTRFMAMFLLVFGRHICVPQRDANMAGVSKPSSINLGNTFVRIPRKRKNRTDLNLSKTFCISLR